MMQSIVSIQYLAKLREQIGLAQEQITWAGGNTDELIQFLRNRGEPWHSALAPENIYKIAINQAIIHSQTQVPHHAQVAFLPPVTGG